MTNNAALLLLATTLTALWQSPAAGGKAPRSTDERLTIELFAEHPQIVTPTGLDVDARGRVFVAESHTHFRPADYDGPAKDRILVFEDRDGDGRAERPTVFHEGFTHIMDIQFNREGWLYVATRMDIHRMRDSSGDGRADQVEAVVTMETTGTYPHNGLSGLAFDFHGDLVFGLGENLGHNYTLVGRDQRRISGGGEGGSTYRVRADGTRLRRVSRGWWNPWGMCVDSFGRVFGTDNDPGASPPCRLIQVVPGADYGYEYRYGRTGLHPLITWTGDTPGTLPMIAGTGEAPCAIVAYQSDALPGEYLGTLMLASWADHRIEYYRLVQNKSQGLLATQRQVLFEGDNNFRPVGLAVAPDGTIYVSDWVSSSYTLHKQGRIWRIRPRGEIPVRKELQGPQALSSADRRVRETAARRLSQDEKGREVLRRALQNDSTNVFTRAAALQALAAAGDSQADYESVARRDPSVPIRVLAVRHLLRQGDDPKPWLEPEQPAAVRVEAAYHLNPKKDRQSLSDVLADRDPYLRHAAVTAMSRAASDAKSLATLEKSHPLAVLLAYKRNPESREEIAEGRLPAYLKHASADVRYVALKWIADDQLVQFRKHVAGLLNDASLDQRLFLAASATLDRLDGRKPADRPSARLLISRVKDPQAPASIRAICLRLIEPGHSGLRLQDLRQLADSAPPQVALEAVRSLAAQSAPQRLKVLRELAADESRSAELRAAAIGGLAGAGRHADLLIDLARRTEAIVRDQSLRALVGVDLTDSQRAVLRTISREQADAVEAVDRLLHDKIARRPAASDTTAWLPLLEGPADPQAGKRVFFSSTVAKCSSCHVHEGRGRSVGPPLTMISRRLASRGDDGRRWLLETLLQPSKEMAPQYTPWTIVTNDGKTYTGLPRRKGGNAEAYLGLDGKEFVLRKQQIQFHRESTKSLMPDGLLQNLTSRELRDLFALLMKPSK